ncbi:hypothetical protein GUJ93_ZPchr0006g43463 [Zizania palustris]|uniref:Uncharacterized protein n=1 Tax=Zizania palustris TaxID=103762 RepID=A0A8J5SVB3_ZIZPA|nr:hypothetical protein GUJ93_ZPchr0006g43463 [Zizania palustris]
MGSRGRQWGEAVGGEMAASVGRSFRWGDGGAGGEKAPMRSTAAPMGTKGARRWGVRGGAGGELVAVPNRSSAQGSRSGANREGAG